MVSRKARKAAYKFYREIVKMLYSDVPTEYRHKYLDLIRKVSHKTRTRIPNFLKVFYCKKCKATLVPGVNAVYRVRARPFRHIAVKCLECGHVYKKGFETKD